MERKAFRTGLLGGAIILMVATPLVVLVTPSSALSVSPPTITAAPSNLMINTHTTLTGRNFPPTTTLRLAECSRTNWVVVAQNPCDSNNTLTVTTGARGGFKTTFKAELCPGGTRVGPTAVRCFIGVPKPTGVDTVTLVGAVKIVVTYP